MANHILEALLPEAKKLLLHTASVYDGEYDDAVKLVNGRLLQGRLHDFHLVRESAHYALMLLIRSDPHDFKRACDIIKAVLAQQFNCPGEVFHGTFRRVPQENTPPCGFAWQDFPLQAHYLADRYSQEALDRFHNRLTKQYSREEVSKLEAMLSASILDTVPIVWQSYDPNWREFIGCTFALILANFEQDLPDSLVAQIDNSMRLMLQGSVARAKSAFTPLNTNIELMHIFISDYFGSRFKDKDALEHCSKYLQKFRHEYDEFHAVAEFNSPTYCSIDLIASAMMRTYVAQEETRQFGIYMEENLWRDIADFYNPYLDNICGPFARNYEMDLHLHSTMHSLFYLALGEAKAEFPPDNCECSNNAILALTGTVVPKEVRQLLLEHKEDRQIKRSFRELNERGDPRDRKAVCTATSWISKKIMLGACSGSQNVSGQLHSATAYWDAGRERALSMRLRRRIEGSEPDVLRTIYFNNKVEQSLMHIEVEFDIGRDIILYFEIDGATLEECDFSDTCWSLPGLKVEVLSSDAPTPQYLMRGDKIEIRWMYLHNSGQSNKISMDINFKLL